MTTSQVQFLFWSSASCQMIVACQTMNFEAPPQYRFRMMNTKQYAYQLSRSLKVCERAPFLDELRRNMSKIWRLLPCTRAVRRMLRNITWRILIDETCFIVKCTDVNFSFAILSFPAFSPARVDPSRCVGIVSADHGVERATKSSIGRCVGSSCTRPARHMRHLFGA